MKKHKWTNRPLVVAPVVYLLTAVLVVVAIVHFGGWPSGSDTYYHIYRGNMLYESIRNGNWYPLIELNWYNGVELMRFWTPACAYTCALCQALAGGDPMNGYLLFVGLIAFAGGLQWLYIGYKEKRSWLCAFLGLYWFFVPNNLTALFVEGNLARSLSMLVLPLFMYAVYKYLMHPGYKKLICISLTFIFMALCHIGYAGMVVLLLIVFFIVYGIATGRYRNGLEILLTLVCSMAVIGIWLVPMLMSDVSGVDSSETMKNFFQNFWKSINPVYRLGDEPACTEDFYYGCSLFGMAVFGIIFAKKKEKAGFITAVITLVLSSSSMYYVLSMLPGGSYLWMIRFFSIAIALSLISLVLWRSLRKSVLLVICVLLVLDIFPSYKVFYGNTSGQSPEKNLETTAQNTLLDEAKSIATQRIALMDASTLGSKAIYYLTVGDDAVQTTFGLGWEAAATSHNISTLNRALSEGYYLYLFDRCLGLGNDTVLLKISETDIYSTSETDIINAAAAVGYTLVDETYDYLLFRYETVPEEGFGTQTKYKYIAIGSGAAGLTLQFPAMLEADSTKLDDFTYDELKDYELIYLDGFTYDDRDYAEELIRSLSENGVRVIIAADGIPEDRKTHDQSFLGVRCNQVVFNNGYPELDTVDGILNTDLFPQGYTTWQTVYVDGLTDVWGSVIDGDVELPFYGTGENENLIYIGINLTYFCGLTNDECACELLAKTCDISGSELPERCVVPATITYDGHNKITITTDYDDVCVALADHDIYISNTDYTTENNLLVVNEGTTILTLHYPYPVVGAIVSVLGLLALVAFIRIVYKEYPLKPNNQ